MRKSPTYRVLQNIARSRGRNFKVLVALAEARDVDGRFSLSEEAVENIAATCRLKAWETEYAIRKLAETFRDIIEADSFLEESKLRSFGEPRPAGKVFLKDDHEGHLALHLHFALEEHGL